LLRSREVEIRESDLAVVGADVDAIEGFMALVVDGRRKSVERMDVEVAVLTAVRPAWLGGSLTAGVLADAIFEE